MDGRIVKKDTVGRGVHPAVSWSSRTSEISGEGAGIISLRIRGESSHGSCTVGVKDRSQGVGGGEREETDSLELDKVSRGGHNGGLVGGSRDPLVDFLESEVWLRGGADVLPRETEDFLALGCRHSSYAHPTLLPPFTHVVQGCLASHFWWDELSLRFPSMHIVTHRLPPPDREGEVRISPTTSLKRLPVATHRQGIHA